MKMRLALPAEEESNALPISSWVKYSKRQNKYLSAKVALANKMFANGQHLTTDLLWQGDGHNQNAALTVFRHFDSATVVKGWIGQEPKTTWILTTRYLNVFITCWWRVLMCMATLVISY